MDLARSQKRILIYQFGLNRKTSAKVHGPWIGNIRSIETESIRSTEIESIRSSELKIHGNLKLKVQDRDEYNSLIHIQYEMTVYFWSHYHFSIHDRPIWNYFPRMAGYFPIRLYYLRSGPYSFKWLVYFKYRLYSRTVYIRGPYTLLSVYLNNQSIFIYIFSWK